MSLAELDHVTLHYGSKHAPVLQDFSLQVEPREFLVLVGPSGCGKTTALNMLAGFITPTSGRCLMRGTEITAPGQDRVVIFQGDDSLYHWLTVAQNAEFPLKIQHVPRAERKQRVQWALELTGLADHRKKYPRELSGGMKQRLQLARALVCETELLLMDEPFGALDAFTRADLQEQLIEIWVKTDVTILFITHDIAEAILLGTRVGVMSHGPEAQLNDLVEIDLPRPRSQAETGFGDYFEHVRRALARRTASDAAIAAHAGGLG